MSVIDLPIASDRIATDVPAVELRDLCRDYVMGTSTVHALDRVSLTVWPGEFVAIMGQSGSGKTTLMSIIGCLDRPTSGSYFVFGRDAATLDGDALAQLRRESFGFVFQRYNLITGSSAAQNVEIPAVYAGLSEADRKSRAAALLTKLGMDDRANHTPNELSGGQQQRVAIARALINDPPIILADEPTGALDSKSGADVLDLLKALHGEGRTILLITHDPNVAAHAECVIRIADGRIVEASEGRAKANSQPQHGGASISLLDSAREALRMATSALRINKFRTALTLLGIVIGVSVVITMMAIGEGSKQRVVDTINAMGSNLLLVRPGAPGVRSSGDLGTLTPDDAQAVSELPGVADVLPERQSRQTVRFGKVDAQTSILGTGADFPDVRAWLVARGQFFTAEDMRANAPVAVLGQTVASELFPDGQSAIGQYVLVGDVLFEVIGVADAKGASPMGTDQDDTIFVPYTTALTRISGRPYLSDLTVRAADGANIDDVQGRIHATLLNRHRIEDFQVRNMASIMAAASQTQDTLTLLLASVAAISLLVGGIGVMNIMLVSVTERTREIGILMATGARVRDIMLQFNIEAAVVCAIGGVIGVALGIGVTEVAAGLGAATKLSPLPASLAFLSAVATGLLFGYLPARKAAHLDPVVALASE